MKELSIGARLFVVVMAIFLLFAAAFAMFQYERENKFKEELLHTRLQDYNTDMAESMTASRDIDPTECEDYIRRHRLPNLRVTIILANGIVIFDNVQRDVTHMQSHVGRKEFAEAISKGHGYDTDRLSATLHQPYFYSATYFPDRGVVIRTALPYDMELVRTLSVNTTYLWFAGALVVLLCFILYRFTSHLGRNIINLRTFANKANKGENINIEELSEFPNDELSEIAERIIKMHKRLEETRQQQDKMKRELTQNIAHELKTPTTSIKGYLEAVLDYPDMDEKMRRQFLERCYAQAERLAALLQDISTLNRIDSKAPTRELNGHVDFNAMVQRVEQDTHLQLEAKHMTICNKLPACTAVVGDEHLLYGVMRNLTDNAIAYAGEGCTITIEARRKGDMWHFRFSDNGQGVAREHLSRIFERFYRVDKGRSRELGGTGLGLAIVKNTIQMHGGTIEAINNEGGGLAFCFTLKGAQ